MMQADSWTLDTDFDIGSLPPLELESDSVLLQAFPCEEKHHNTFDGDSLMMNCQSFSVPVSVQVDTRRSPSVNSQASCAISPTDPLAAASASKRFGTVPVAHRKTDSSSSSSDSESGHKRSRQARGSYRKFAGMPDLDLQHDEDLQERDLSNMTQKQRNQVSALKYRKRRKMYLNNLENKVTELESTVKQQNDALSAMTNENRVMREQLEFLKRLFDSQAKQKTGPVLPVTSNGNVLSSPSSGAPLMFFAFVTYFLLVAGPMRDTAQTTKMQILVRPTLLDTPLQESPGFYTMQLMDDRPSGGRMLMGFSPEFEVAETVEIPQMGCMPRNNSVCSLHTDTDTTWATAAQALPVSTQC